MLSTISQDLKEIKVLSKKAVSMLHSGAVYTSDVVAVINKIEDITKEIERKFK